MQHTDANFGTTSSISFRHNSIHTRTHESSSPTTCSVVKVDAVRGGGNTTRARRSTIFHIGKRGCKNLVKGPGARPLARPPAPAAYVRYVQGSAKRWGPRLRECCRQGQTEVLSNSRNKFHQTWGPPSSRNLYVLPPLLLLPKRTDHYADACARARDAVVTLARSFFTFE